MYNLYEYIWFFVIYSFFGWCGEVAFAAIKTGRFVNRGFLSGPVCPIYGAGMCIVVLCLTPFSKSAGILFVGSVILTSVLEFLTGFLLEKLYNEKWWDYSERKFNIKGYICLEFSLLWGVACVAAVKLVHSLIAKAVAFVPLIAGVILICVIIAAYIADASLTFVIMHKFRVSAKILEKVVDELKEISDGLGEKIFERVIDAKEHTDNLRDDIEELKDNAEKFADEISERYGANIEKFEERKRRFAERLEELRPLLVKNSDVGRRTRHRLVNAFPNLKLTRQHRTFEITRRLKERFSK